MYDIVFVLVVVLFFSGSINLISIFICFRFIDIIRNTKKTNWLENLDQKKVNYCILRIYVLFILSKYL